MRIYFFVLLFIAVILTAGCAGLSDQQLQVADSQRHAVVEDALQLKDDGKVAAAAQVMLQISEKSIGSTRSQYLFDAAQYYLQVPDLRRANDVLNKLVVSAPGSLYVRILRDQIALQTGRGQAVASSLAGISLSDATPLLKGIYWMTLADAWEVIPKGVSVSPAKKGRKSAKKERVGLADASISNALQARLQAENFLLSMEMLSKNQDAMWKLLSSQTSATLKSLRRKSKSADMNAWFDLALLAQRYHSAIPEKTLASWSRKYSAQVVLNQRLMDLRGSKTAKRRHVALILPTRSLEFGSYAKSVWDGFQMAQKELNFPYPVKLYETSADAVTASNAYKAAVENGAVLIVGPLPRNSLTIFSKKRLLAVPTIALNAVDEKDLPVNLYQFGLPITQEAKMVARGAKEKGFQQAIVLKGGSVLDQRSAEAFMKEWMLVSNTVQSELPVQDLLGMMRLITDGDSRKTMIFVAADFKSAFPAIKSLPSNWSIFGTSALNTDSPEVNRLDKSKNIYFVDMPTLLKAGLTTGKSSVSAKDDMHARLYSLGLDVCGLSALMLKDEIRFNRPLMNGATGKLRIARDGNVERELPLVLLRKGNSASYSESDLAKLSETPRN